MNGYEIRLCFKDRGRELSEQLLGTEVELQRARSALAERDQPDKKEP